MTEPSDDRRVRSFVRRDGRVTAAQRRALDSSSDRFYLRDSATWSARINPEAKPLIMEIGCGNGGTIIRSACAHPATNFLGVETYSAGLGTILQSIEKRQLSNLRLIGNDVIEVIETLPSGPILDEVWIFFPDPWPKKRHHKRRLITATFLDRLARILKSHGVVKIATDWENYAEQISEAACKSRLLTKATAEEVYVRPKWREPTRFETTAHSRGRAIFDFLLVKRLPNGGVT